MSSKKILVIDDDDTAREVVRALIASAGYPVVPLSTPIGATRLIREIGISAVVCDLNMPAMRGDSLARLFKGSKALQHVRIILISGAPREELETILLTHAVDAVVHKSDLQQELLPKLRKLLAE
jgi:two-component system OmpR family response regulator